MSVDVIDDGENERPKKQKLPAICSEMKIHLSNGEPVVKSREVAEMFGKEHKNVLRDIEAIEIGSDLSRCWFRPSTTLDSYGREQPSFDLTRQGFTLLVMGWTGEKAMLFKVKYIQAFDEMEQTLRYGGVSRPETMQGLRELLEPLEVRFSERFDKQDKLLSLMREENRAIGEASLKRTIITLKVKNEHYDTVFRSGGNCPSCREVLLIVNANWSPIVEWDHWYAKYRSGVAEVWPLCKDCHAELTHEWIARDDRQPEFNTYQRLRRKWRPQKELF